MAEVEMPLGGATNTVAEKKYASRLGGLGVSFGLPPLLAAGLWPAHFPSLGLGPLSFPQGSWEPRMKNE